MKLTHNLDTTNFAEQENKAGQYGKRTVHGLNMWRRVRILGNLRMVSNFKYGQGLLKRRSAKNPDSHDEFSQYDGLVRK